jgi:hypothetical protein
MTRTLVKGDQMNLSSTTPSIELLLHPRQVLNLDNKERRMAIACKHGVIWVTSVGENEDHILRAGKSYTPKTKGKVLIEAIGEATVDIEER